MIIDTQQSDIQVIGDIKEFKTSIDPRNIELITTLLSSNLYSNPEKSFIREIVSNAWDSHVEAGTTDIPVIIKFDTNSITIRDYGTGLSPERFKEVYCNIGSSTKRDSNEFIGGFGIGKYSSLACSNTVFITSYYEGMEYSYIMIKDGNNITTTLANTLPTKEKNGVSVTISKENIDRNDVYYSGIKSVIFFPNIYIKGKYENINKIKIKRFKYFAFANSDIGDKLLLGNVLYPCDKFKLNDESKTFLSNIYSSGMVISFNIGELNITPNRENVIYTETTINKINERIKQAKDEVLELIKSKIIKDYTDLIELKSLTSRYTYYNPITEELNPSMENYYDLRVSLTEIIKSNCTYKGHIIDDDFNQALSYLNSINPNIIGLSTDVGIRKYNPKCYNNRNNSFWQLSNTKIILVNPKIRFTRDIRSYLETKFTGYTLIKDLPLKVEDFIDKDIIVSDTTKYVLQEIIDYHLSKAISIDFKTDVDFLKYKESLKDTDIPFAKDKTYILYNYNVTDWSAFKGCHEYNDINELAKDVRSYKSAVVLDYINSDNAKNSRVAHFLGYEFITASKPIVEYLKSLSFNNVITVEQMFSNHKLSIIRTLQLNLWYSGNSTFNKYSVLDVIPPYYNKDLESLINLYTSWNLGSSILETNYVSQDDSLMFYCNLYNKYYKEYLMCHNIIKDSGYTFTSVDILVKILMIKRNKLRLNHRIYSNIFRNQMFKLLCKK